MDCHSNSVRYEHFNCNFQFYDNEYTPKRIGCQKCLHNAVNKFQECKPHREPSPKTTENLKSTESIIIEDSNDSEYSIISTWNPEQGRIKEISPEKQSTIKPEPKQIQSPRKSQTKTSTTRCSICHKQLEESANAFKPAITKPQTFTSNVVSSLL